MQKLSRVDLRINICIDADYTEIEVLQQYVTEHCSFEAQIARIEFELKSSMSQLELSNDQKNVALAKAEHFEISWKNYQQSLSIKLNEISEKSQKILDLNAQKTRDNEKIASM